MTPITREQIDSLRAELKATIHLFATNMKPEQRHAKCATFLLENGSNVFALLDIAEAVGWQPIESAPKARGPMIVVRGVFADRNYVTDPWCVFWQEGKWQRWPHDDPPTHWMPLPVLPLAGEVAGNG